MAELKGDSIVELFSAVMLWAASTGARDLNKTPGLWHGKTERHGDLGPLDVRINPHAEKIEHVPPFSAMIGMDDCFPGIIGIVGPYGGEILHSPLKGENEDGLIAHFKAQTRMLA